MKIRKAIDEFIADRESLGRKRNTKRFYRFTLGGLAAYLEEEGVTTLKKLGRREIRGFFATLNQRGLSDDTLAAYDRSIRAFCKFCMLEGWLKKDPLIGRPRLKQSNALPDTWSLEEVDMMLAACGDGDIGMRDQATMLLMLDAGLRAGEVIGLTLDRLELNRDRGEIMIPAAKAKDRADRLVPIWTETVTALRIWLEVRPSPAETVFVASNGRRMTTDGLTEKGLNMMMHRRAEQAGLNGKRRLCHIWRHTFAKRYVLGGGDLATLARLMGHESLETLKKYLKFKTEDLVQRHWELSPVRQLYQWRERNG
ncbi:MAG: tyrosine-type recombinase/integrase [Chloroflexota bacterium]